MRDSSNVLQQQAIGILGVNLIYAAFYEVQTPESFLEGLASRQQSLSARLAGRGASLDTCAKT
jgi:hypothetical protein